MKEKGGRASVGPLGFECAFWRGFMTVSPGPGNYHPSVCGNFREGMQDIIHPLRTIIQQGNFRGKIIRKTKGKRHFLISEQNT